MTINSNNGLISWTPNVTGTYNVTVSVTDGLNTVTQPFNILVSEKDRLVINTVEAKIGDEKTVKDLKDGDRISKEAQPGDNVKFDIGLNTRDNFISHIF